MTELTILIETTEEGVRCSVFGCGLEGVAEGYDSLRKGVCGTMLQALVEAADHSVDLIAINQND